MKDRNLPQTASKQGYFYTKKKVYSEKLRLKRDVCFLNLLMFYVCVVCFIFCHWKFLTFDFIILKYGDTF